LIGGGKLKLYLYGKITQKMKSIIHIFSLLLISSVLFGQKKLTDFTYMTNYKTPIRTNLINFNASDSITILNFRNSQYDLLEHEQVNEYYAYSKMKNEFEHILKDIQTGAVNLVDIKNNSSGKKVVLTIDKIGDYQVYEIDKNLTLVQTENLKNRNISRGIIKIYNNGIIFCENDSIKFLQNHEIKNSGIQIPKTGNNGYYAKILTHKDKYLIVFASGIIFNNKIKTIYLQKDFKDEYFVHGDKFYTLNSNGISEIVETADSVSLKTILNGDYKLMHESSSTILLSDKAGVIYSFSNGILQPFSFDGSSNTIDSEKFKVDKNFYYDGRNEYLFTNKLTNTISSLIPGNFYSANNENSPYRSIFDKTVLLSEENGKFLYELTKSTTQEHHLLYVDSNSSQISFDFFQPISYIKDSLIFVHNYSNKIGIITLSNLNFERLNKPDSVRYVKTKFEQEDTYNFNDEAIKLQINSQKILYNFESESRIFQKDNSLFTDTIWVSKKHKYSSKILINNDVFERETNPNIFIKENRFNLTNPLFLIGQKDDSLKFWNSKTMNYQAYKIPDLAAETSFSLSYINNDKIVLAGNKSYTILEPNSTKTVQFDKDASTFNIAYNLDEDKLTFSQYYFNSIILVQLIGDTSREKIIEINNSSISQSPQGNHPNNSSITYYNNYHLIRGEKSGEKRAWHLLNSEKFSIEKILLEDIDENYIIVYETNESLLFSNQVNKLIFFNKESKSSLKVKLPQNSVSMNFVAFDSLFAYFRVLNSSYRLNFNTLKVDELDSKQYLVNPSFFEEYKNNTRILIPVANQNLSFNLDDFWYTNNIQTDLYDENSIYLIEGTKNTSSHQLYKFEGIKHKSTPLIWNEYNNLVSITQNMNISDELKIFPNPFNESINIFSGKKIRKFKLLTQRGTLLYEDFYDEYWGVTFDQSYFIQNITNSTNSIISKSIEPIFYLYFQFEDGSNKTFKLINSK
jgi:hypothetical protein